MFIITVLCVLAYCVQQKATTVLKVALITATMPVSLGECWEPPCLVQRFTYVRVCGLICITHT
eukprot:COSAG01_NODE_66269_length_270_cov_1.801170_1_plen_62_part_01